MRFIYVNPETDETTYPFGGFAALRQLHPNVSFPRDPSPELLAEWGLHPVAEVDPPASTRSTYYDEGEPALVNGVWTMTWAERQRSQEAVDQFDQAAARRVRARRDALLQKSDFTQLADASVANAVEWATFRQALRAIPQQPGFPHNVSWPAIPTGARVED